MARPPKEKQVSIQPKVFYFRPVGVPLAHMQRVRISLEELAVVDLVSKQGLSQTQAAQELGVHQSTVQRVLARTEKKLATAILEGQAIEIEFEKR